MATALNTSTYDLLNSQIQAILKTYAQTALITIYSDADGNNVVTDSHGPIKDRQAMSVSYTKSYLGADGNPTSPYLEIFFLDGSTFTEVFKTVDNEHEFWYTLSIGTIKTLSF